MAWTTMLAIYFVVWWVVLFAVLPFGVRSQAEQGEVAPGTDPGAPTIHGLAPKLLWTTLVSGLVCGAFYWIYVSRLVSLQDLATLWGLFK